MLSHAYSIQDLIHGWMDPVFAFTFARIFSMYQNLHSKCQDQAPKVVFVHLPSWYEMLNSFAETSRQKGLCFIDASVGV